MEFLLTRNKAKCFQIYSCFSRHWGASICLMRWLLACCSGLGFAELFRPGKCQLVEEKQRPCGKEPCFLPWTSWWVSLQSSSNFSFPLFRAPLPLTCQNDPGSRASVSNAFVVVKSQLSTLLDWEIARKLVKHSVLSVSQQNEEDGPSV